MPHSVPNIQDRSLTQLENGFNLVKYFVYAEFYQLSMPFYADIQEYQNSYPGYFCNVSCASEFSSSTKAYLRQVALAKNQNKIYHFIPPM